MEYRKAARAAALAFIVVTSTASFAYADEEPTGAHTAVGTASWYGPGFDGRRTANGETFDMNALTAAHRTLPFGTRVRVTNLANGESVIVRINDRGPYVGNRVIDLSRGAADAVNMVDSGLARVSLEILG